MSAARKDLVAMMRFAQDEGAALPVTAAALKAYETALAAGTPLDDDATAVAIHAANSENRA